MVVRLGERPPNNLAGAGYRRILQGQTLQLHSISDAAVTLRAWARVVYDDGQSQLLTVPEVPRAGDRTAEVNGSTDVVIKDGWVVNAEVEMVPDDIKRGQTYVRLAIEPFGCVLLNDYCFSGFGTVSLGTYVPPGPAGGSGNLRWVAIKAEGVPADFAYTAAVSNVLRRIREINWYYACDATVSSRTPNLIIESPGAGLPTGYAAGAPRSVLGFGITLTANQDGILFMNESRHGVNDNGVTTVVDNSTSPVYMPIWVSEDNILVIVGDVTNEQAGDFDVCWGLFEDWVLP